MNHMPGTPKEVLESFSKTVTLRAGLTEDEIALFQTQMPGRLPIEIRELLIYSAGFETITNQIPKSPRTSGNVSVLFTGNGNVGLSFLPWPVSLLVDGCGNFWVVDVNSSGAWGAVLFVCHDPPVVVMQARDLATFISQILQPGQGDLQEALKFIQQKAVARIWRYDPWLVSVQDARRTQDGVMSRFAEELPENFRVADIRATEVGSGFSWGRAGPNSDIRRSGAELIFGVEQKPPGLLSRILSGH